MNNEEAKLLLSACRVGGQDAQDPHFAEALEQARRDPELAAWFARERRIDAALAAKIKHGAQPPANLKTAILASAKIIKPDPWWKRPAWATAAAAVLVLSLTLFALWPRNRGQADLVAFEQRMTQVLAADGPLLEYKSSSAAEVKQWLADRQVDFVVPAALEGRPTIGCRVLDWHGRKVSLACFRLEGGNVVHLFAVDRSAFARGVFPEQPRFLHSGAYATAVWSAGDRSYLLACGSGEESLRKLL